MAAAERLHRRHQPVEVGEARDDGAQHRHQLLLLLGEIGGEHRAQRRRDLEQAIVEEVGGGGGDRGHLGEARLHELDLGRVHGDLAD